MAFVKHNWKYGDKITATHMNEIEDGVADNEFCVQIIDARNPNKTYRQIERAFINDTIIIIISDGQRFYVTNVYHDQDGDEYVIACGNTFLYANTMDDYPHFGAS